MNKSIDRKMIAGIIILAAGVALGGCNGGSSSSSGSTGSGDGTATEETQTNHSVDDGVSGPLDAAQTPLFEDIFGQLTAAAAGTPLEASLDCAGQAIVIDLVDVLDSIALALIESAETQDPATAFENAAGNIEFSLGELANDLPGALTALNGDGCNGQGGGGDDAGSNPLAGTPLEPLGEALMPVLEQFPDSGGEPDNSPDSDLHSLSVLVVQLSQAFSAGLAQIPPEARAAPIFGGVLNTLNSGFNDLAITLIQFGSYNGAGTATALENTLNNLLVNVLTEVIPVNFLEAQAGQPGVISGPITAGVDQVTEALGENLLSAAIPQLTSAMDGELAVLLDPIENTLLPALLGPVSQALAGGGGSPLDLILGPVTDALTGSGDGSGPTGTPLDALLAPLLALTEGDTSCPFAATALDGACVLYDGLSI